MDSFTYQILKHPHYGGHISQLQKYYIRKPRLAELTFTKIPKTTVTCTHCFGNKAQAIQHPNGFITYERCSICYGSGTMEIDNR